MPAGPGFKGRKVTFSEHTQGGPWSSDVTVLVYNINIMTDTFRYLISYALLNQETISGKSLWGFWSGFWSRVFIIRHGTWTLVAG